MKLNYSNEDCDMILQAIDTDKSGQISEKEFILAINKFCPEDIT